MSNVLRVCVVTGTRADYGLLRPVMFGLREHPAFALQVVATGSHLAPEFGLTVEAISADGLDVDERVEMLLSSDTAVGVTTSLGLATIRFADVFDRLAPDLLLVLGDRYEILAAVQAALVARLPVAHLSGGDVTEGAIDDAIRHAVTKMAHLHFVTNEPAAARVRQMGEAPELVVVAGNPGLDDLVRAGAMPRAELSEAIGLELRERNLLVTYHPATLADEDPDQAVEEILAAIDELGGEVGVVITLPNADAAGRAIMHRLHAFAGARDHVVAHASLGQARYWSCLKTFDVIVGNSSSGLTEAPAAGLPSVNVGQRQGGRLRATSTVDVPPRRVEIAAAIVDAMVRGRVAPESPYGDGRATERILSFLAELENPRDLLMKRFHQS